MKCLVFGCSNHDDQGRFVGSLCAPCHEYLSTGKIGPTNSFLGKLRSEPAMKLFNINDYVLVRLTEYGRQCLRKNHDEQLLLFRQIGYEPAGPFELPQEDAGGWSRWPLWLLMRELGPHLRQPEKPFHTTIILEEAP